MDCPAGKVRATIYPIIRSTNKEQPQPGPGGQGIAAALDRGRHLHQHRTRSAFFVDAEKGARRRHFPRARVLP